MSEFYAAPNWYGSAALAAGLTLVVCALLSFEFGVQGLEAPGAAGAHTYRRFMTWFAPALFGPLMLLIKFKFMVAAFIGATFLATAIGVLKSFSSDAEEIVAYAGNAFVVGLALSVLTVSIEQIGASARILLKI